MPFPVGVHLPPRLSLSQALGSDCRNLLLPGQDLHNMLSLCTPRNRAVGAEVPEACQSGVNAHSSLSV